MHSFCCGIHSKSEEAQKLNIQIFETLYYGALEASCKLAEEKGKYETYEGSPVSKGILQYDMWDVTPTDLWDWAALKRKKFAKTRSQKLFINSTNADSIYCANFRKQRIYRTVY